VHSAVQPSHSNGEHGWFFYAYPKRGKDGGPGRVRSGLNGLVWINPRTNREAPRESPDIDDIDVAILTSILTML